jgi:hypothetical protein
MKTNELSGAALDWAVAKCEEFDNGDWLPDYSTDWAAGGPIIEREGISVCPDEIAPWCAFFDHGTAEYAFYTGETPLIAAMRCYVASKLGDDVQLPEELK